ncbi:MAG: FecR family protein [Myxococcota bacterium]
MFRHTCLLTVFFVVACSGEPEPPARAPTPDVVANNPDETAPDTAAESEKIAVVKQVDGVATQGGVPLVVGEALDLTVPIEVTQGRVILELDGVGTLRLFPASKVQVRSRSSVKLFLGKIWAKVSELGGESFEVETETAVAGVRGTEFIVSVGKDARVKVLEGTVAVTSVSSRQSEVLVRAGEQTQVQAPDSPPAPPKPFDTTIPEAEWRKATERFLQKPSPRKKTRDALERPPSEVKKQLEREEKAVRKELEETEREQREKLKDPKDDLEKMLKNPKKRKGPSDDMKDFLGD